jgi:hypothetical protein
MQIFEKQIHGLKFRPACSGIGKRTRTAKVACLTLILNSLLLLENPVPKTLGTVFGPNTMAVSKYD